MEQADDPWVTGLVAALTAGARSRSSCRARMARGHWPKDSARPSTTRPVSGVLSLLALASGRHSECEAVPQGVGLTLALMRALEESGGRVTVWHATRCAEAVGAAEQVHQPGQLGVQALGRVAARECSGQWTGTVDLPGRIDGWTGSRLAAVLAHSAADGGDAESENDIAVRGAGLFARRVVRSRSDARRHRSHRPVAAHRHRARRRRHRPLRPAGRPASRP